MTLNEVSEQAKNYLADRLKSPYIGAVIAVWIVSNRILVFGLFNFEDTLGLQGRIDFVGNQLQQFPYMKWICGWTGFTATVIHAALWGFVVMISADALNTLAKVVFNSWDRIRIYILQKQRESDYILRTTYIDLESRYDQLSEKWSKRVDELEGTKSELKDVKDNLTTTRESLGKATTEGEKEKANLVKRTKELLGEKEALDLIQGIWYNEHSYGAYESFELLNISGTDYSQFNGQDFEKIANVTHLRYDSNARNISFCKNLTNALGNNSAGVLPARGYNLINDLRFNEDFRVMSGGEDTVITIKYTRLDSKSEIEDLKRQMKEKFAGKPVKIYFKEPTIIGVTNSEFIPSDFLFKNQGSVSVWVRPSSPRSTLLGAKEKRINNMYVVSHAAPTYDDKSGFYRNVFALSLSPDQSEANQQVPQKELFWKLWLANDKGEKLVLLSSPLQNDSSEWTNLFVRWNHDEKVGDFYVNGGLIEAKQDWTKYWPEINGGQAVVGSWGNTYLPHLLNAPIYRLQTSEEVLSDSWLQGELKLKPSTIA